MNEESSDDAASRDGVVVKTEPVEEGGENADIKDFAETTMNELLGWYGYDKVGSHETKGLNLQRFTSAPSPASVSSTSPNPSPSHSSINTRSARLGDPSASAVAAGDPPEEDCCGVTPNGHVVCAWCQKVGAKLFTLRTTSGVKAFCSEICFTQCRRASFKKYKGNAFAQVCDWCKHIRHTVNYVDFQDGEQQLQFCSDKCLNQYKMNIFCRETQAHLKLHPHHQGNDGKAGKGNNSTLITPELWLRDCSGINVNGAHHDDSENENILEMPASLLRPASPAHPLSPASSASKEAAAAPHPLSRHSTRLRVREKRRRYHSHQRPHFYHANRLPSTYPANSAFQCNGKGPTNRVAVDGAPATPGCPATFPERPVPLHSFGTVPRFPPPVPPITGLPPITVMVPYPIFVPVPIPIPIPIPLDVQQIYARRRRGETAAAQNGTCQDGAGGDAVGNGNDDDNDGDCEESDVEVRRSRVAKKEQQKRHRSR